MSVSECQYNQHLDALHISHKKSALNGGENFGYFLHLIEKGILLVIDVVYFDQQTHAKYAFARPNILQIENTFNTRKNRSGQFQVLK